MTDYKAIFGKKIKFLTTDLSTAEGEGEIFYSDTAGQFKTAITSGAWSAGSPLGTARYNVVGCGTLTAGLAFAGRAPATGVTEEYNGTGWTESGDLNTARQQAAGFGTQTAALGTGGFVDGSGWQPATEEYDG